MVCGTVTDVTPFSLEGLIRLHKRLVFANYSLRKEAMSGLTRMKLRNYGEGPTAKPAQVGENAGHQIVSVAK